MKTIRLYCVTDDTGAGGAIAACCRDHAAEHIDDLALGLQLTGAWEYGDDQDECSIPGCEPSDLAFRDVY